MATQITERRLVDVLVSYLRQTRFVEREVKHYDKRIDVVASIPCCGSIEGVEAKSENWSKAIQQAILNLTAVDYSYVAIWSKKSHLVDEHLLSIYGVGLISVGTRWGDVEVLIPAQRSEYVNRFVHEQLRELFPCEAMK